MMKVESIFQFKNKKGTVIDILPILFLIAIVTIMAFVGARVMGDVAPQLNASLDNNVSQAIINNANADYSVIFDTVIPMFFVGLCLGMIVSAFFVKTKPLFFFITVLLLVLILLIVPVISNVEDTLCNQMTAECDDFTRTDWIFDNLPLLLMIVGFITTVVLYAVYKT